MIAIAKDWYPPKNQNQKGFHEITTPLYVSIVDQYTYSIKSILNTSTAYKATLDKKYQKYNDECYATQEAKNYQYEYGAVEKKTAYILI